MKDNKNVNEVLSDIKYVLMLIFFKIHYLKKGELIYDINHVVNKDMVIDIQQNNKNLRLHVELDYHIMIVSLLVSGFIFSVFISVLPNNLVFGSQNYYNNWIYSAYLPLFFMTSIVFNKRTGAIVTYRRYKIKIFKPNMLKHDMFGLLSLLVLVFGLFIRGIIEPLDVTGDTLLMKLISVFSFIFFLPYLYYRINNK